MSKKDIKKIINILEKENKKIKENTPRKYREQWIVGKVSDKKVVTSTGIGVCNSRVWFNALHEHNISLSNTFPFCWLRYMPNRNILPIGFFDLKEAFLKDCINSNHPSTNDQTIFSIIYNGETTVQFFLLHTKLNVISKLVVKGGKLEKNGTWAKTAALKELWLPCLKDKIWIRIYEDKFGEINKSVKNDQIHGIKNFVVCPGIGNMKVNDDEAKENNNNNNEKIYPMVFILKDFLARTKFEIFRCNEDIENLDSLEIWIERKNNEYGDACKLYPKNKPTIQIYNGVSSQPYYPKKRNNNFCWDHN